VLISLFGNLKPTKDENKIERLKTHGTKCGKINIDGVVGDGPSPSCIDHACLLLYTLKA
jgi:hypothetical protein